MQLTNAEINALFDPILTVRAKYVTQDGAYKDISVVFENKYFEMRLVGGIEVEVETASPIAYCRDVDIAGIKRNDIFVINSIKYHVIGIQPNGYGVTRLVLSRDEA